MGRFGVSFKHDLPHEVSIEEKHAFKRQPAYSEENGIQSQRTNFIQIKFKDISIEAILTQKMISA